MKISMCLLLSLAALSANCGDNTTQGGRFQLFSCKLQTFTDQGPVATETVFRIDTETGYTYRLMSTAGSNGFQEQWRFVREVAPPRSADVTPPESSGVVRQIREIDEWVRWCDQHTNGGDFTYGGSNITVSADQISTVKSNLLQREVDILSKSPN